MVAPAEQLGSLPPGWKQPSAKFVHNCEYRFFQRPDDAIIRGYDKQAEADLSSPGAFLSNYEPLPQSFAKNETEDAIRFGQYTAPMKHMVEEFVATGAPDYYCTNAYPRIVDGKPTKNPRYLQTRPDLKSPRENYLATMSCGSTVGRTPTRRYSAQSPPSSPAGETIPPNPPPE